MQCECQLTLTIDKVPVFVDLFYYLFDRCQSSKQIATAHGLGVVVSSLMDASYLMSVIKQNILFL